MDTPYATEISIAIPTIQLATRISKHVLASANKGTIEKAEDLSPVTVADFAIQAYLTKVLSSSFPTDSFVGEESAAALRDNPDLLQRVYDVIHECVDEVSSSSNDKNESHAVIAEVVKRGAPESKDQVCELVDRCGDGGKDGLGADSGRTWVFDPIDGTKTFVCGEQYAINVALLEGGKQILSVVACPLLSRKATAPVGNASVFKGDDDEDGEEGCIVYAVRGFGAYVRPLFVGQGSGLTMCASESLKRHADGVTVSGLRSVSCWNTPGSGVDDAHKAATERLGVEFPGSDLLGWVPRWVTLALGLANMTVWVYKRRDRYAKIWDHAGAMLLFEEVGGMITDVDGKEIDLTKGRKLTGNFGFVAAPRSVHHVVLKAVRQTLKEQGKEALLTAA
ncbi:hypothetical protein NEUTE1DRAFT_123297 [Neurospora tetrasperma FGSC 2508]|uniref:Carbohydrate phosphatase n=1 Tax=Neurospora tetrasperma (strain FGSC 2508 / ATCC MYA-4615 / P0657) TaxID=510951 RepID=F8MRB8_NEUT8|nr:uncharacterized protein NEUTE1DRAFT_123297 [Neurospora tetrasperma FGSC 2508]EGO56872.1 hypothetical protein NEUTE1DRAFT_123297 [Neurospora tetrasperma FGSC 2508]EGZ70237.1 carbohydrate phosphatase [Neurospora tetrasperma FGSC 2509]